MVEEVVWTIKASKTFWQIIDYLSSEFGENAVARFVTTVHSKIELIRSNPYLFHKSTSQKNVFITVIHKRTTLTYRYRPIKKRIELIVFWSTRMNPAENRYKR
jgi:plasmid stabilization system protein ParE